MRDVGDALSRVTVRRQQFVGAHQPAFEQMLRERLGGLLEQAMHLTPGDAELRTDRFSGQVAAGKLRVDDPQDRADARRLEAAVFDQCAPLARGIEQQRHDVDDLERDTRALIRGARLGPAGDHGNHVLDQPHQAVARRKRLHGDLEIARHQLEQRLAVDTEQATRRMVRGLDGEWLVVGDKQ